LLAAGTLAPAAVAPDDTFTILYTSGTTSFPKGAIITHANCVPHGWNVGETLRLTAADRVLHALPAAGTWGGVNIPLTTWSHGACLVLMDVFDPLRALQLIERERCTVLNAVDSMLIPLLDHPDLGRRDLSSLRTGGVAAVGGGRHGLLEDVLARLVPLAFHPYGMTEVNAMALHHSLDESAAERLVPGVWPAPGLQARVADPEIEAFLLAHAAVAQAFVVGIPDPKTNETPVAYVIRKPGAALTEDELRAWCHGKIASFKIPRAVRFVDDVPRTPSSHGDKVQRVKLREQALKEFGR